ncbi:MAG: hypothetical protein IJ180_11325 [Bacteroidales bacterium]|nr:hypothetical protein [Bacteroidales bacterium]MBQ9255347.1 hypothetical protein [Bacteroidales bacterium]
MDIELNNVNTKFNKFQSTLEEIDFFKFPDEVREQFLECLNSIIFIQNLTSYKRPYVQDLPRDDKGRAIIDFTNPPLYTNSDFFRPTGILYEQEKKLNPYKPTAAKQSDYYKWIGRDVYRSWNGYLNKENGMWIPGDMYWYLNYCMMDKVFTDEDGTDRAEVSVPSFWEGQWWRFLGWYTARQNKVNFAEIASRRKGKSNCAAARGCRDFYIGESEKAQTNIKDLYVADSAVYLNKGGVLNLFEPMIDFIARNTSLSHQRIKNNLNEMEWVSGYTDLNTRTKMGSLNQVLGLTISDDPDKPRGKAASFIYFEEFGNFGRLQQTYDTTKYSVKQGNKVRGMICLSGTGGTKGCLTENSKVLKSSGEWVSVKNIKLNDTIIGYDINKQCHTKEIVEYLFPSSEKECVRITTNNFRTIECSIDHPIYSSNCYDWNECRVWDWHIAETLKTGDLIAIAQETPIFGNEYIPDPYIVGVLIGDGCYSSTSTILHNCDGEIFNYIKNRGYKIHDIIKPKLTKDGKWFRAVTIKNFYKHLEYLGIRGQSKQKKRLPDKIFQASKEDVCEILAGLFDTDGCITIKKKSNGNRKPQCNIIYTSYVFELIEQVRFLLNKLGINCSVTKVVQNKTKGITIGTHTYYNIVITDSKSVITFYKNIHLKIKYKQDNLYQGYLNALQTKRWRRNKFEYEKIIDIEYIGKQLIYNISANNTHTYLANGIITHNSNFQGALDMIYHPEASDILPFKNVWDISKTETSIFFYPAYVNYEGCFNKDGISDVTMALKYILLDRYKKKYGSANPASLAQAIAEQPITIQDSIMKTDASIFPTAALTERILDLDKNPNSYADIFVGMMIQKSDGTVDFVPTGDTPIRQFPHTASEKRPGAIEIHTMPIKDKDGKIPYGRYISSFDPVEDDSTDTETLSLQSFFMFDLWTDTIVAEYTGRTEFTSEFYEQTRLLNIFYNSKMMYENNKKSPFAYYQRMHSLNLLAETPEYLKSKGLQPRYSIGNKVYGIHNVGGINSTGIEMLRDWLCSPVTIFIQDPEDQSKEKEVQVMRLHTLKCKAFLQECAKYNSFGNFDRISSMIMMMLYREEKLIVKGFNEWDQLNKSTDNVINDPFFSEYDRRKNKSNTFTFG